MDDDISSIMYMADDITNVTNITQVNIHDNGFAIYRDFCQP